MAYSYRQETEEAWLRCLNWTIVRKFTNNNKDKFFEYMFIDSGLIVDILFWLLLFLSLFLFS